MEMYLLYFCNPCFVGPYFALDGCLICFFSLSHDQFLLSNHHSWACLQKADQAQRAEGKLRLDHFLS